ncbi:CMRF35-like molecule 1 [Austrofundulus limnaeus]|uniref:CMRF35-like molecule 1 n=1 Tax=Austrofundulus limnaeus TaxID=52670 RepID=A0A2I4CN75_AUSLI|nr:PREDICTED: CMRF35-like molecule 1 [Austrofundulus limnaeus]
MKSLLIAFFCFLAMCMATSDILEVSGHVGENVSIPCFGSWTTDDSENISMYFCKGVCSRENTILQTNTKRPFVQQGRHSMEVSAADGVLTVSIKRLRRADAGSYLCGVKRSSNVSYQEVTLKVVDASSVSPGSPSSTKTNLQTHEVTLPEHSFPSSTEAPAVRFTLPPSGRKKSQQEADFLTDTIVVIIVSGSLACLVCAIIPIMFYRHWQKNAGQSRPAANKTEDDRHEESVADASTQVAGSLQSEDCTVQYASVYEGLDPKTID